MCGRFASFRSAQDLADDLAVADVAHDAGLLAPSWNVAPTDAVRIVVERPARLPGGGHGAITRSLQLARWGLVPSWAKDPGVGARMINARSETLLDKPAFARPLGARRCLVPAEGYYEWRRLPAPDGPAGGDRGGRGATVPKQPYWIHPAQGGLAFAGLYEFWRDPARAADDPARWLVSTTIITTAAAHGLAHVHDRMPVALPPAAWDAWLDPAVGAQEAAILVAEPVRELALTPVTTRVNAVRNDGPRLLEPDPEPLDAGLPTAP
ncbi:SOS response-associated peptidase [Puerhibacterium puerhi]|uniref:SOS response-associated peptidase n=1 Tax=Puerhibacterium puerhi TaxID=2692623 RepID=UPI00135CADEE|nr:SOS response-associated peptidase [Puerhibacterium puerhi]